MNCNSIPNNLNNTSHSFYSFWIDLNTHAHNIEINYYLIRYLVICTSFYKQNTFTRFETWTKKMKCEIWKLINNYCENMYLNFVFAYLSKKMKIDQIDIIFIWQSIVMYISLLLFCSFFYFCLILVMGK